MARSRFKEELLDELLMGQDPKSVLSSQGLLGELKKALAERMMKAEKDLRYSPLEPGVRSTR
jgi:putative transposase